MNQERERPSTQGVDGLRAQQIQSIVDTDKSLKHPDLSGGPPEDPSTSGGHLGGWLVLAAGLHANFSSQTISRKLSSAKSVQLSRL